MIYIAGYLGSSKCCSAIKIGKWGLKNPQGVFTIRNAIILIEIGEIATNDSDASTEYRYF